MMRKTITPRRAALFASVMAVSAALATPAEASTVLTQVGADISSSPYTFDFMGSSFTFDGSGGFPTILSVKTDGNAAVRTVFGNPSTDFVNRGTVVYGPATLGGFGAFPALTAVPYSNGDNFLGLRVSSGGQDYYGFAYTTNAVLNGFGFETTPGASITATTALAGAVPEPASWALLLIGFFAVGGAMRATRRRQKITLSYS